MLCDVAGVFETKTFVEEEGGTNALKGGEALRKRCIRGRKLRALIVWKYYRFLAKHCKVRAMSWFRRLRKDDDTRRVLAREVSRASGVKKHELTQELAEFDRLRVNPPPDSVPAHAACFYVAPSEEELERRQEYQHQKKLRMKEHKKLVLIGRKRAKAFNASVRSRTNQEVRNEKRKREKDEDASQARLAVEAAMDAIETKRCTETTLSEDQQLLCEPLLAYFERKVFPREVSAAYLRYWRAGPRLLNCCGVSRETSEASVPCRPVLRHRRDARAGGVDTASTPSPRRRATSHTTPSPPPRHRRFCSRRQGEPRRPLLLAPSQTEEVARLARLRRQREAAQEEARQGGEKERLKRAKENAKKRASRDRLKAEEQAAKDAAAAEKRSKEPPKPKKRRAFAAGDVFRSRVTAGHKVIEEEKIDLGEKSPEKPDPYAEDRRKQSAQLKKIQGYLHRAQTIVKEVRIQQVRSFRCCVPVPSRG